MQSLKVGLDHQIAHFDGHSEKAFKTARNNAVFEQAVRQTWSDNPAAAEYVLAHTNSLFFAKDDAPRKGNAKAAERYVMGVYLDDAMARSELNARREVLMLALMRLGLRFDELRIIASTFGMRERRLYPAAVERVSEMLGGSGRFRTAEDEAWAAHAISEGAISQLSSQVDDARVSDALAKAMRAYANPAEDAQVDGRRSSLWVEEGECEEAVIVRRAICLAVGDIDEAQVLLDGVSRVDLTLCRSVNSSAPSRFRRYWCVLYAQNPALLDRMIEPYREAVIARARELGLAVQSIACRQA